MRLKSLMLTPTLIGLSLITAAAAFVAITTGPTVTWLGVVLAAAPLPVFVLYLMIGQSMARTSADLMPSLCLSIAGAIMTAVAWQGLLPFALATGSAVMMVWYVFVYSRLSRPHAGTVALGARLPDFVLQEASGVPVHSSEFDGQPTLLLFYRGNWCPLCMAQILEVAAAYRRLTDAGVEVALISPQPAHETAKLAAKFDVPFRFLIDTDLSAARALGVAADGGVPVGLDMMGYGTDTVFPTVIATDANGAVIFVDETDNYRVRPEPETFLSIFDGLSATIKREAA